MEENKECVRSVVVYNACPRQTATPTLMVRRPKIDTADQRTKTDIFEARGWITCYKVDSCVDLRRAFLSLRQFLSEPRKDG